MHRITAVLVLLISSVTFAAAADVTFEWNASNGATGYYVHSSVNAGAYNHNHSSSATNWINAGNPCNAAQVCTFTWTLADPSVRTFFVVTAFNSVGESTHSNEVFIDPSAVAPNAPTTLRILP